MHGCRKVPVLLNIAAVSHMKIETKSYKTAINSFWQCVNWSNVTWSLCGIWASC